MNTKIMLSVGIIFLLALMGCSQTPEVGQSPKDNQAASPQMQQQTAPAQQQTQPAEQQPTEVPAQPANEEDTAVAASGAKVKEFEITAMRFQFEPSTLTVNKGDTVRLHVTSTDVAHGFGIPEFGVNEYLPAQKTVDIEFIANQAGEFPFVCNVFCGSGHKGMKGMLVVQ